MGTPRTPINTDYIVSEYNSNKSVNALAKELNVSRNVILQRLHAKGIKQRNRSEAMLLRMSEMSCEERKHLVSAANNAKRGKPNTPEMLHKRALAGKRFIGKFEQEFYDALTNAGIPVIRQEPFLSYNLDLGCGNIAVEIHTQGGIPTNKPHTLKRIVECLHAGKNMLYVAIPPTTTTISDSCYQQVIAIVQACRTNPPIKCQYWVIRSTGKIYATGGFDFD